MSEQLARLFHETYEQLAPTFGYAPQEWHRREESAVPWEDVPARNKNLMIAVTDIIELKYFGGAEEGDSLSNEFFATNGYGVNTKRPFVALSYNGRKIAQMFPEDAINLAHNLLAVAEASLGDAFLIEFLRDKIGIEMSQVGALILQFREWRDQRAEQQEGGTP